MEFFLKRFGDPVHSDIESYDCHMSPSVADSIIDLMANIDVPGSHAALSLCSLSHPLLRLLLLVSPPKLFGRVVITCRS